MLREDNGTDPVVVYPQGVQLRRQRPLACFDPAGVECAAGQIFWRDVESVALVESDPDWHDITVWQLTLRLRPGARPLPPKGEYYHGRGRSRVRGSEQNVSLPLWSSAASVLVTIRRFYDGPSTDVVTYEEPRGWPGDDIGSFTEEVERQRKRKLEELFPPDGQP